MQYRLRISGHHYEDLKNHLFPGDGMEAVVLLLCGRHQSNDMCLLMSFKIVLIPYAECERYHDRITWKTDRLVPLLEEVEKYNLGVVKIHSHPGGFARFSSLDDDSDAELFPAVFHWSETDQIHGSAVMLPNGKIFGRVFDHDMTSHVIDRISVAGDHITIWDEVIKGTASIKKFAERTIQAFGEGTFQHLQTLKIGVIGCSGTGSPIIEQLVRLEVGKLVLIDPDPVEEKNLNRIINTFTSHVGMSKVSVLKNAIEHIGLGTKVTAYKKNLYDSKDAIDDLITSDLLMGCIDSVDGRHLISNLANFYLLPYFDLGVRLVARKNKKIESIVASVNFIKPGHSSLFTRKLYTAEMLREEATARSNPEEYKELLKRQYFRGMNVDRPAVISVNMQISSTAVNELLNRIHPYKDDPAVNYARVMIDYCAGCIDNTAESEFEQDAAAYQWAGRGDYKPFLRMPDLNL